jgi:hypothetical protein
MTPEEIVAQIRRENRALLYSRTDYRTLDPEQILALMDAAAIHGFRIGSDVALSIIQGGVAVEIAKTFDMNDKPAT